MKRSPEQKTKIRFETNNSGAAVVILDWAKSFACVFVVLALCFIFVFRIVRVDGISMFDTLVNNDRVILTELFYTPEDGDIVVIAPTEKYGRRLIKRVIATEGETLRLDYENEKVIVDGVELDEPYIYGGLTFGRQEADYDIPEVIPEGKVFVMGDNRNDSMDSRDSRVGLIDRESIVGKATLVFFPFDRFRLL